MSKYEEINLGDVKIDETDESRATLRFNLPLRISLHGKRSFAEYEKALLDQCRLNSSMFFSMIDYFGSLIAQGEIKTDTGAEFISLLSEVGKSYLEASETIPMDFERWRKNNHATENILDLSAQAENLDITAERFAKIVNDPQLPKEFQRVLDTYCEVKQ